MPRNGSGVYAAPASSFNPAVTTAEATPVDWNALLADFSTAITGSIAADGQTTITADLPLAGFKLTGVGNATARTNYASAGQVQDFSLLYAADTGAADAYAILPTVTVTAYAVGQQFRFKVGAANLTATPTLQVSALATPGVIKWPDGSALAAGDLPLGAMVEVDVVSIGPAVFHLQSVANFTGTGKLVKSTSPALVTPALGTPASGVLTNCTSATPAAADNSTKLATTAYVDKLTGSVLTNSLSSDVALTTTAYFTGPSVAQGSTGTWFVSGTVTITGDSGASVISAKLWDGTTVIASTKEVSVSASAAEMSLSLSGQLATPAGNLRISVASSTSTGNIVFNSTGNSKDSTITAFRIA